MSYKYCGIPLSAAEGPCGWRKCGTLVPIPHLLKCCPNRVMKAGEQSLVQDTGGLCQGEVLILRFLHINGPASSVIMRMKVLYCLWKRTCKQLKVDVAQGPAMGCDVEEH
ncbi:hypothetical protein STEG23_024409, partial [Scotinomys teguina]